MIFRSVINTVRSCSKAIAFYCFVRKLVYFSEIICVCLTFLSISLFGIFGTQYLSTRQLSYIINLFLIDYLILFVGE